MTSTATSRALLLTVLGIGAAAGAGATYLALASRPMSAPPAAPPTSPTAQSSRRAGEASVRLTPIEVGRARITLAPVETGTVNAAVTIPAVIEPNAYKQTVVTALVAGRVTRVLAELGQHVRRGETLAEVYSPELADAQRTYIASAADLRAHEQQLARIEGLTAIGSASRQELEMAHAEHAALTSSLEGARSRLELIGLNAEQVNQLTSAARITATTAVRAPLDGVVTVRQANVGLNIEGTMPLFTVADLSTVWVVGELYERDFPDVRVGRPATIAVSAFPALALRSTVSYIDPQLSRDTRTAKVRAEVLNAQGQLRLGMYAQMRVDVAETVALLVPKTAIQTIGDHAVVYVADPDTPGRFTERVVRTGAEAVDRIAIESGVAAGESVVSTGSFFLRAERERLGQSADGPLPPAARGQASVHDQTARITVSEKGFAPDHLSLIAGMPAQVTFVRTTDDTCAKEVAFPSLGIRRALPLNTPVVIDFTPSEGDTGFVCGVNMFRGTVAAR